MTEDERTVLIEVANNSINRSYDFNKLREALERVTALRAVERDCSAAGGEATHTPVDPLGDGSYRGPDEWKNPPATPLARAEPDEAEEIRRWDRVLEAGEKTADLESGGIDIARARAALRYHRQLLAERAKAGEAWTAEDILAAQKAANGPYLRVTIPETRAILAFAAARFAPLPSDIQEWLTAIPNNLIVTADGKIRVGGGDRSRGREINFTTACGLVLLLTWARTLPTAPALAPWVERAKELVNEWDSGASGRHTYNSKCCTLARDLAAADVEGKS
jgi:hypothetical protein